MYEAAVKDDIKSGRLREMELCDFQESHDITMIWRKGSIFSDRYRSLYEQLKG